MSWKDGGGGGAHPYAHHKLTYGDRGLPRWLALAVWLAALGFVARALFDAGAFNLPFPG